MLCTARHYLSSFLSFYRAVNTFFCSIWRVYQHFCCFRLWLKSPGLIFVRASVVAIQPFCVVVHLVGLNSNNNLAFFRTLFIGLDTLKSFYRAINAFFCFIWRVYHIFCLCRSFDISRNRIRVSFESICSRACSDRKLSANFSIVQHQHLFF